MYVVMKAKPNESKNAQTIKTLSKLQNDLLMFNHELVKPSPYFDTTIRKIYPYVYLMIHCRRKLSNNQCVDSSSCSCSFIKQKNLNRQYVMTNDALWRVLSSDVNLKIQYERAELHSLFWLPNFVSPLHDSFICSIAQMTPHLIHETGVHICL